MATVIDPTEAQRRLASGDLPQTVGRTSAGQAQAVRTGAPGAPRAPALPPPSPVQPVSGAAAAQLAQITPQEVERNLGRARRAERVQNAASAFNTQRLAQETAPMRAGGVPPGAAAGGAVPPAAAPPAAAPAATPPAGAMARAGQVARVGGGLVAGAMEARNIAAAAQDGPGAALGETAAAGTRLGAATAGARLGAQIPGPPIIKAAGAMVGGGLGYVGGQEGVDVVQDMATRPPVDRNLAAAEAAHYRAMQKEILGGRSNPDHLDDAAFERLVGANTRLKHAEQQMFGGDGGVQGQFRANIHPTGPSVAWGPRTGRAEDFYMQAPRVANDSIPDGAFSSVRGDVLSTPGGGHGTFNGQRLTNQQIQSAAERLGTVPSGGPMGLGVAHSMMTGGETLPLAPARGGGSSFNTRAAFEVADSQRAREADKAHQSRINDLASKAEWAISRGKRKTARAYTDLIGHIGAGSGRDGGQAQQRPTGAQEALAQAEAAQAQAQAQTAGITAQQAQRVAQLQQQLMATSDPEQRAEIQGNINVLTGGGRPSAAQRLQMLEMPTRDGGTIKVPLDPSTGQFVIPDGYNEMLRIYGGMDNTGK
jgi:hypothetical protein